MGILDLFRSRRWRGPAVGFATTRAWGLLGVPRLRGPKPPEGGTPNRLLRFGLAPAFFGQVHDLTVLEHIHGRARLKSDLQRSLGRPPGT
jgi:hypothetical protein